MSPTILRIKGHRFFFFSNEGNKPPHIHIESGDCYAKFWLKPVLLEKSRGFSSAEINSIRKSVEEHQEPLLEKWNEYFEK